MNRRAFLIAAGVIFAIATIIFFINRRAGGVRDLAPVNIRASQVTEQDVHFPALTPDGKKLVYFGVGEGDRSGIIRMDLATRTRELFRPLPQVSSIVWSPDRSQAVLWVTYDENVLRKSAPRFINDRITSLVTAAWLYDLEKDRLEGLTEFISSAAWNPAGDRLLYHYVDFTATNPISELSLRTPFGAAHEKLTDIAPAPSYTLAFLDATTVMAVPNLSSPSGTSTMYIVDLLTKAVTTKEEDNISAATASPDGRYILLASAGAKRNWRLYDRLTDGFRHLKVEAAGQYGVWIGANTAAIVEPGGEERDRIWIVDVNTFTRQELLLDNPLIDVESQPQVVGKRVYFKARGKLYTFALPR